MNFSEFDTVDIEEKVRRLEERISKFEQTIGGVERVLRDHQHGGIDGSAQIYNSNIRLKDGSYIQGGIISLGEGQNNKLTILSGSISITSSYHTVDTEAAAATDDLDNISVDGAVKGQLLVLRAYDNGRSVVLKDGTGNLRLAGDMTLDHNRDTITLIQDRAIWYELARSNNDT